jgi:membrane protease YdiL (CAAX protease family)
MPAEIAAQPEETQKPALIAPVWHTILVVLFFLAPISLKRFMPRIVPADMPLIYLAWLQVQWIAFMAVVAGLAFRKTKVTDLIGVRWRSKQDFFRDFALGVGFSLIDVLFVSALYFLFGPSYKTRGSLLPQDLVQLLAFLPVAVSAGITEELIFRGYLLRQFHAISGRISTAIVLQAALFSLAHGYNQSAVGMIEKFWYGLLIALFARWRKSLLPGILSHSWQDSAAGILAFLLG